MNNYKDKYKKIKDLIDFLSKIKNTMDKRRFLELTFNKLFSYCYKANLGSLYQFTSNSRIKFIDSVGHNIRYLKKSDLHLLDFQYSTGEIKVVKSITDKTKRQFIRTNQLTDYKEYVNNVIDVKETLLIPLLYEGELVAEYALEISNDSKKSFNDEDIELFGLFKKIIENKFNEIIYKKKSDNHLTLVKDKYKKQLNLDHLTKIYNKKYFYSEFKKIHKNAFESKKEIALIMIDIDYFKNFNDAYGHIKGDEILIEVAKTLKDELRKSTDTIFRYGGEEFIAIVTNANKKEVYTIAERLKKSIEGLKIKNIINKDKVNLTISLGVHIDTPNTQEEKTFLNYADKALYKSKSLGRNKISFYNK